MHSTGHPAQAWHCLVHLLCVDCRIEEKLVEVTGVCCNFRQRAEKQCPDLLRHGFGRTSNNNSLVNLHLSVFVLAREDGVVGFPILWVKHQLSHCKTIREMRKFSVSVE